MPELEKFLGDDDLDREWEAIVAMVRIGGVTERVRKRLIQRVLVDGDYQLLSLNPRDVKDTALLPCLYTAYFRNGDKKNRCNLVRFNNEELLVSGGSLIRSLERLAEQERMSRR